MIPTAEEAEMLVAALWRLVDGDDRESCAESAMEALAEVWPDVPWLNMLIEHVRIHYGR